MYSKTILLIVPLLIAAVGIAVAARPGSSVPKSCDSACQQEVSCPCCSCKLNIEEVEVKKHCYRVETVQICIPEVRLPFLLFGRCCDQGCDSCTAQGCDQGNGCGTCCGARCKTVRVLVKEEYKCKDCKCVWTPVNQGCATVPGIIKCGDASKGRQAAVVNRPVQRRRTASDGVGALTR